VAIASPYLTVSSGRQAALRIFYLRLHPRFHRTFAPMEISLDWHLIIVNAFAIIENHDARASPSGPDRAAPGATIRPDLDFPFPLPVDAKPRRGIQSIEIGSKLLIALAAHLKPLPLRDLAREAGMSVGKAHPYLVSFVKVGFVTQEPATGLYALGPLALQIGLAKLYQLDPVREAAPVIAALAASTEQSVAVAVWGNLGPTIVQLVEPVPMHVNLRVGAVMSVRNTATGRLFASYLPPKVVENFLAKNARRTISTRN
jgi:hypothetical protein